MKIKVKKNCKIVCEIKGLVQQQDLLGKKKHLATLEERLKEGFFVIVFLVIMNMEIQVVS